MAVSRRTTDNGAPTRRTADPLAALDGAGVSRHQIKIMFVSGMGFLADAYDLFVIGIVVALLKTDWALTTSQVSWLNSATALLLPEPRGKSLEELSAQAYDLPGSALAPARASGRARGSAPRTPEKPSASVPRPRSSTRCQPRRLKADETGGRMP